MQMSTNKIVILWLKVPAYINEILLSVQTDRQTDRQADRQTGRQAGRQSDRQTDRQKDTIEYK